MYWICIWWIRELKLWVIKLKEHVYYKVCHETSLSLIIQNLHIYFLKETMKKKNNSLPAPIVVRFPYEKGCGNFSTLSGSTISSLVHRWNWNRTWLAYYNGTDLRCHILVVPWASITSYSSQINLVSY